MFLFSSAASRKVAVFLLSVLVLASCGGGMSGDAPALARLSPQAVVTGSTASFNLARASYTVIRTVAGYNVVANSGGEGITRIGSGVKTLVFSDITVNLAVGDKAASLAASDLQALTELYVAYFNRVPDADGLSYWIDQFKAGQTLEQIGQQFYAAALQYASLTGYSASMTNTDFVTMVYRNVLGRSTPDAAGLSYWNTSLANGSQTRGTLVRTILAAAHAYKGDPTYGAVADLLDNKFAVANYFAVRQGLSYALASDAITKGMAIAAAVTSTSTQAARALIASADSSLDLSVRANVNSNSSYTTAKSNARAMLINWQRVAGFGNMWTARAMADLDGDGIADAVVAPGIPLEVNASLPMLMFKGSGSGSSFNLAASGNSIAGTAPRLNHARKLLLADFNGDGVKDIFVCAHGYDSTPFPGTTNALLLSGGGRWTESRQAWSTFVGFHHGCASGDIDGDGDEDIIVTNGGGSPGVISYFLINDGQGNFTQTRAGLPASINRANLPVFVTELVDLDGDGAMDLLVGGQEPFMPTSVFWGSGDGTFSDSRVTTIPAVPGWPNVLIFSADDIDADGKPELVVMRTKDTPDFYKGYLAQVLKLNNRSLTDITSSAAAKLNASAPGTIVDYLGAATWSEWTWLTDYDGDGKPDLVSSDAYGGAYWARNLGGSFAAWTKLF